MCINSRKINRFLRRILSVLTKNLLRISVEFVIGSLLWSCCVFASSWWLKEVDWEVELAFVIGRRGKHIKVSITTSPLMATTLWCSGEASISSPLVVQEEDALSYVAGFTVANDVSARDWQMNRNGNQWLLGKTFDSFCPLGPALVTTDAVKGEREERHRNNLVNHTIICENGFLRWMWVIIIMAQSWRYQSRIQWISG